MPAEICEESVLEHVGILHDLYDVVRAVNPTMKMPISFNAKTVEDPTSSCYDFWKRGGACDNCISMRAYQENDMFIKLEYNAECVYLVTAVPVEVQGQRLVIEMLKDVTGSGIIEDGNSHNRKTIHEEINQKNRLIVTDALTQAYNRRYMDERLPFELLEARMNKRPVSVALVDIDGFKRINDVFGHASGDRVIQAVSNLLKAEMRGQGDWFARQGGDEFCILLKHADAKGAFSALERLRKRVESAVIPLDEGQIASVTLSIGVATVCEHTVTVDELLQCVDQKLYLAKSRGKNNVVGQ